MDYTKITSGAFTPQNKQISSFRLFDVLSAVNFAFHVSVACNMVEVITPLLHKLFSFNFIFNNLIFMFFVYNFCLNLVFNIHTVQGASSLADTLVVFCLVDSQVVLIDQNKAKLSLL